MAESKEKVLGSLIEKADQYIDSLSKIVGASYEFIGDHDLRNAVMAYRLVLQATQDVLGDRVLQDDVAVEAIKAGSYIAWRGIMGQAQQPGRRI